MCYLGLFVSVVCGACGGSGGCAVGCGAAGGGVAGGGVVGGCLLAGCQGAAAQRGAGPNLRVVTPA